MPADGIVVVGLDSLIRDLRGANRVLPRVVSKSIRDTTKRELEPDAKINVFKQPVPKSRTRVTSSGTTRGASLVLKAAPWVYGAEFGALRWPQFRPWVGNQFTGASKFPGYILGKAITDNIDQMERIWLDEVVEALAKEGALS